MHVNPVTTLVTAYLGLHPATPLPDAIRDVKRFLGMPTWSTIGRDVRRSRALFDGRTFLAQAQDGGFDQLVRRLAQQVDHPAAAWCGSRASSRRGLRVRHTVVQRLRTRLVPVEPADLAAGRRPDRGVDGNPRDVAADERPVRLHQRGRGPRQPVRRRHLRGLDDGLLSVERRLRDDRDLSGQRRGLHHRLPRQRRHRLRIRLPAARSVRELLVLAQAGYSGRSQTTPSGGSVTSADCGWSCHGRPSATTAPRFPTPLPP